MMALGFLDCLRPQGPHRILFDPCIDGIQIEFGEPTCLDVWDSALADYGVEGMD